MTISNKLILLGCIIFFGFAILAGNTIINNKAVHDVNEKAVRQNNYLHLLKTFNAAHSDLLITAMKVIIHRDKGKIDAQFMNMIHHHINFIHNQLIQMNELCDNKEANQAITKIRKIFPQLMDCIQINLVKLIEERHNDLKSLDIGFQDLYNELNLYGTQIKKGLSELFTMAQDSRDSANNDAITRNEHLILINQMMHLHANLVLLCKHCIIHIQKGSKNDILSIKKQMSFITNQVNSLNAIQLDPFKKQQHNMSSQISKHYSELFSILNNKLIPALQNRHPKKSLIQLDHAIELIGSNIRNDYNEILNNVQFSQRKSTERMHYQNQKYSTLKLMIQAYGNLMMDVMDVIIHQSEIIADLKWMGIVNKNTSTIEENLFNMFKMRLSSNEDDLLENVNYFFQRLSEGIKVQLSNLIVERSYILEDLESELTKIISDIELYGGQITIEISKLLAIVQTKQKLLNESVSKRIAYTSRIGIITFAIALIFCIPSFILFAQSIIHPINRVVSFAKHVADGHLNETLVIQQKDEIGYMGQVLNDMVRMQSKLIQNLKNLPSPVIEMDLDYTIIYINDAGTNMLGLPFDQCIGQKCHELFHSINCHTEKCPAYSALKNEHLCVAEIWAMPNGKTKLPLMITAIPIKENNHTTGVLEFIVDQTTTYQIAHETKNVSEQLNQAAEHLMNSSKEMAQVSDEAEKLANQTLDIMQNVVESGKNMSNTVINESKVIEKMTLALKDVVRQSIKARNSSNEGDKKASEIATRIKTLVGASEQIGKVITLIKSISDRTDLLALNAAIEAESAGNAGQGFAVVADEVKKLAKQSAEAADEIAIEIDNIQKSTRNAMQFSEQIDVIMHDIAAINNTIADAISTQYDVAGNISEIIAQTAKGSQESSDIANNACMMVNQIAQLINQLAAHNRHTHHSSEILSDMSKSLYNFFGVGPD